MIIAIHIQCRVIQTYGITTGILNNRSCDKRDLHIFEDGH